MEGPRLRLLSSALAIAASACIGSSAAPPAGQVPFVGCPGDGQTGPVARPETGPTPQVSADAAPHVAYYASRYLGVLAPRGWHCFEIHGSNLSRLLVAPGQLGYERARDWQNKLEGPAVEIVRTHGGTSGRFGVAAMIARLFPAHRGFFRKVESMGFEMLPLPDGPFPHDVLERRGTAEVGFVTPAGREGLGTYYSIGPTGGPIGGFVVLLPEEEMSMVHLNVRLRPGAERLARTIVRTAAQTRGERP